MSTSDDEERSGLDPTAIADQRRRYQWYVGYSRDDEYEKHPEWAVDIWTGEISDDDGVDTIKYFDKFAPREMWIESDTEYDLMRMC